MGIGIIGHLAMHLRMTSAEKTKEKHSAMGRGKRLTVGVRRSGYVVGTVLLGVVMANGGLGTAGAASPSFGAASGSVASISGTSMEVQSPSSGQTTVAWTASTQFTKTVTLGVSSVGTGDCVSVSGTPSKKSKTTIAARTITVTTAPASGSCTAGPRNASAGGGQRVFSGGSGAGGFAGGFRQRTGTGGGSFRTGGAAGGRLFGTNLALGTGKVTSVSGSKVSVSGVLVSFGARPTTKSTSSKKKPVKAPALKTEKLTITTSKSTTVTQTQSTTASALAVGDCVIAAGPQSSTGSVTATTVRITSSGGATCSVGFGFGGPGGPPGGGGGGA